MTWVGLIAVKSKATNSNYDLRGFLFTFASGSESTEPGRRHIRQGF